MARDDGVAIGAGRMLPMRRSNYRRMKNPSERLFQPPKAPSCTSATPDPHLRNPKSRNGPTLGVEGSAEHDEETRKAAR